MKNRTETVRGKREIRCALCGEIVATDPTGQFFVEHYCKGDLHINSFQLNKDGSVGINATVTKTVDE
jgi:hypothetical protein